MPYVEAKLVERAEGVVYRYNIQGGLLPLWATQALTLAQAREALEQQGIARERIERVLDIARRYEGEVKA